MSDALPLPPRPNLGQYKKLAKDLQGACKTGDIGAIRQWAAHWIETLARLKGTASSSTPREREREAEQIERRWNKLRETSEPAARCTLAGTQFFIAREHGFKSWPKFAGHVQQLDRGNSAVSVFEAAADAIISGNVPILQKLLAEHPGLARERSTREHRSTLLHYVSANGVEDFRQKTPKNIVEITKLLLDAGAEVDAESDAYGGGCTTLGLVATSAHPERAGVQIDLLRTLIDRGASLHHPSAGGNNHTIVPACLHNGQPEAARFLADLGAPLDLESAAALGRLPLLRSYFEEGDRRQPAPDQKEVESAFLSACAFGSADAVEFLLNRGIDPLTRNEDGQTGLHLASWGPHIDVIKLLMKRGAPVDVEDDRFHATPLDMALWTWDNTSNKGERDRCYEAIALLVQAGAKLDPDHWCDDQEDGSGMLRKIDDDPRMMAALRGDMPR
jgi:ankyrin repeat protein